MLHICTFYRDERSGLLMSNCFESFEEVPGRTDDTEKFLAK